MKNIINLIPYEKQILDVLGRLHQCIQKEVNFLKDRDFQQAFDLLVEKRTLLESYQIFFHDLLNDRKFQNLAEESKLTIINAHDNLAKLLEEGEILFESIERSQKKMLDHLGQALESTQKFVYKRNGDMNGSKITSIALNKNA
jgi:L-cysteine desulfidase